MTVSMISFIRASKQLMPEVCTIINSNMNLYKGILENPEDIDDYFVNEQWVTENFKKREFYLLRESQKYVGMVSFQILKDFGYVGYLHVKFAKFRRGYGAALVKFLEMRAKKDKISKLRLFTHPKALWALNFYEKLGFQILERDQKTIDRLDGGVLKPYHGKHHILFEKRLI